MRYCGATYSDDVLVYILCDKTALIAIVLKNVDFPEAFEPVSIILFLVSSELATGFLING